MSMFSKLTGYDKLSFNSKMSTLTSPYFVGEDDDDDYYARSSRRITLLRRDYATVALEYFNNTVFQGYVLKNFAVYQLGMQMLHAIQIIRECLHCKTILWDMKELPHKCFSWSAADFYLRRKQPLVWLSLMEKEFNKPHCLEIKKTASDLQELQEFVKLLFQAFVHDKLTTELQDHFEDTFDHLTLLERLEDELSRNSETYAVIIHDTYAFHMFSWKTRDHKKSMQNKSLFSDIIFGVQYRYARDYYKTVTEQFEIETIKNEKDLKKCIELYQKKTHDDNVSCQCATSIFYTQLQAYRYQVGKRERQYNEAFEYYDNEIKYKHIQIKNLEDLVKQNKEKLVIMREKYEKYIRQQELEEIELQQQKLREEEEEKARLKASKRKLKKDKNAKKKK